MNKTEYLKKMAFSDLAIDKHAAEAKKETAEKPAVTKKPAEVAKVQPVKKLAGPKGTVYGHERMIFGAARKEPVVQDKELELGKKAAKSVPAYKDILKAVSK